MHQELTKRKMENSHPSQLFLIRLLCVLTILQQQQQKSGKNKEETISNYSYLSHRAYLPYSIAY